MKLDWPKTKLKKHTVKIGSGITPKGGEAVYKSSGIPLIRSQNVLVNRLDLSDVAYIEESQHKKMSGSKVYSGDVLLNITGASIGRSCVVPKEIGEANVNQHVCIIRLKETLDARLLSTYLNSWFGQKQIWSFQSGGSREGINFQQIGSFDIPLPPLPEQKAIADILSTWDEAIEKTEKLIKEKERRFKANVQKLITNNCENWDHVKPETIFNSVAEKNFPDEELLSVTQDRGVIPRSMLEGRVMSPDGTTETYKLIKKGDFVISLRSFQGGIEYSEYRGIISPAYTVLRPKIEINKDFYKLFFKTYVFIEKYLNIAVIGIRDGKQISIPDFMTIKIPFPPLSEQKSIAETLNTAQDEINLLKKLSEKYKQQ
ncbi:MAG TPA: restriction endonuclease subunit S, partial [bacterium]|nr:restriction endonuclease subunit S [bacterium]